jgi:hypothetical protein
MAVKRSERKSGNVDESSVLERGKMTGLRAVKSGKMYN